MLTVKKRDKRPEGEFSLSGQLTINNERSHVESIYNFLISLQKQKIFSVYLQMIF